MRILGCGGYCEEVELFYMFMFFIWTEVGRIGFDISRFCFDFIMFFIIKFPRHFPLLQYITIARYHPPIGPPQKSLKLHFSHKQPSPHPSTHPPAPLSPLSQQHPFIRENHRPRSQMNPALHIKAQKPPRQDQS